jgi:uncharacterized protein YehS (DUF1456 family)
MIELFKLGNREVSRAEISSWLKKEEDPDFQVLNDLMLAVFLNGLIVDKRGKKDGPDAIPENILTNNLIFKKLKIAFNLRTADIVYMFKLIDKTISEPELTAFFRNPKQGKYRECNDQYLRNFLSALQQSYKE